MKQNKYKKSLTKFSILKYFVTLILALLTASLLGQTKSFKIDASLGFSYPKDVIPDGFGLGILTAIEPKFDINKFSLGTRVGFNILRSSYDVNYLADDQIDKFDISILLTGDYYLKKGKFRPFLGIGTGVFFLSVTPGYDITSEKGEWKSYGYVNFDYISMAVSGLFKL